MRRHLLVESDGPGLPDVGFDDGRATNVVPWFQVWTWRASHCRAYTIWQRRKESTQKQVGFMLCVIYFSGNVFQGVVSQRLVVKHM